MGPEGSCVMVFHASVYNGCSGGHEFPYESGQVCFRSNGAWQHCLWQGPASWLFVSFLSQSLGHSCSNCWLLSFICLAYLSIKYSSIVLFPSTCLPSINKVT